MATIHKLTKDGSTIFPATITDAVVHPNTGKTLTSMIKDYNVSELFPTEGVDGGNKYNLALAIQVLGVHLTAEEKSGGIKLTFISTVSGNPSEEYYLNSSSWSTEVSDWGQRFEVGGVVADPSGSWEPSSAQEYIDEQVGEMTTELTSEIVARQTGDSNLQTQIDSVVERVDDAAFIGDRMGSETLNPDFDPETDTIWNKPQVLSAAQKTQVKQNLGIDTELQLLHNQYTALTQSNVVVGPLPAAGSGQTNTIYRVPGTDSYSDYMYATQGGTEILMATYNNGIDTVPTPNSTNVIESNAVAVHGNALDISELNKNGSTLATYTSLSEALATVPAAYQRGGMSIKFIQLTPATYSVVKTEGLTEQPTGTVVQEALAVGTGSYTAEQLSGITLPTNVGGSVTYWLAVTVDEVTTYTTWVVTYASAESQEYVQYRLMKTAWSRDVGDWQGVDDEPTAGSRNLVESGGVKAGLNTIKDKQDKIANSDIHAVQYINPSFVVWDANVSLEKIVAAVNYRCDVYELKKGEVLYLYIYQNGADPLSRTNLWKCVEKPAVDSAVELIENGSIQDGAERNMAYIATEDCYVILERFQRRTVNVIASKRNAALDTVPLYVVEPLTYTTGAISYICCNPDDENYGEAVSQSFYTGRATNFVDITGAKFLRILLRSADTSSAALDFGHIFYDADKQPISVMAKFNVGFSYALRTYVPVPANAVYARFTVRDGESLFILKDLISSRIDSTDNTIKEIENSIEGLESKKEYPLSMYNNYYKALSISGDVCSVVDGGVSNTLAFIPVKEGEVYKFTFTFTHEGSSGRALSLCLFDAPPTDIGVEGTLLFRKVIKSSELVTAIVKMPKNGYLARAVYLDSSPAILNQYKLADDGFDEDVYIKQNVETSWTADSLIDIDHNSENYGSVQTGITDGNYITSDYINVEGVKYILLRATKSSANFTVLNYLNNTFGSIFYDENKNPIDWSGFPVEVYYRKATVVTRNQGLCFIQVPDNAVYLRVTNYKGVYNITALKDKLSEIDFTKIVEDGKDYKGLLAQAKFVTSSPTIQSLGLVHFSDIHGDQTSADAIRKFINDYSQYITDVLCTGDSVHYYADPTSSYPQGSTWWKETSKLANKSLFVLGNHDSATPASTEYDQKEDSAAWDGKGKDWCFTTYFEPYIETLGYVMPNGYNDSISPNYHACYWHKDYTAQKIRVIGLDCLHRFDGILNPTTGEITTAGVKWTTNEQELWLIEKLNETLDSTNAAYSYSVIVTCHYPIDNFSGNNEEWDDTTHKFVYNQNAAGGRVMDFKTGDVVGFHYGNTTSYLAALKFNMNNRVDNGYSQGEPFPNYTQGSTNNVANIIQNWMNNGGKFVVWLCGHTHVDFMWYSTKYPNILCVVLDQAGCLRGTNTGDRSTNLDSRVCANYYSIDTQNGLFKIVRVGYTMNKLMNSHEYLCYDYINRKVLNEG